MSERPTIKIKTPMSLQEVEVKEWITGREQEFIQQPIIDAASIKAGIAGGQAQFEGIKSSAITESSHRTLETMIVSIDGVKDGLLDKVLDMRREDYEFVLKEIDSLLKKK